MPSTPATPTSLRIDMHRSPTVTTTVVVAGEVDLENATQLADRLLATLAAQTPARLTVDFAGVGFLDCAGITALVTARNAALSIKCRLRITNPRPGVRRILVLAGLYNAFTVPDDLVPLAVTLRPTRGIASVRVPRPAAPAVGSGG
jgi:anti-anti-sigma factor